MNKLIKGTALFCISCALTLGCLALYLRFTLPDTYYISYGEKLKIPSEFSIKADNLIPSDKKNEAYKVVLKLMDAIPVKDVEVKVVEEKLLVPAGTPFGIKMITDGVIVVGMTDIQKGMESSNPAKDAGLKIGDILMAIDDNKIYRNNDVKKHVKESEGNEIKLTINREGEILNLYLKPVMSPYDQSFKAGFWVRDTSAGIGTMTYYDPATLSFGGLGHAVCDSDTGKLMPLFSGEIVDVNITGSNMGLSGKPGELKGSFNNNSILGNLNINTEVGVFGRLNSDYIGSSAIPMAFKQEVVPGPAKILSTISGSKPREFDIVIEKINYSNNNETKNMVIRVTDKELLSTTGGIVQGMSGSPIIQNGKLVGAVTHVFVNDPSRGYSIFAENMYKVMLNVENVDIAS